MKPTTDNLKTLSAKHAQLLSERDRHAQMIEGLAAEEIKMLPALDMNIEADFKKLSDIRLRREIVPKKVEQYEAAAAEVENQIKAECENVARVLAVGIRSEQAKHLANVTNALAPFISDAFVLEMAVNKIIDQTTTANNLRGWEFLCSNTCSVEFDPVQRAAELIEAENALAAAVKS